MRDEKKRSYMAGDSENPRVGHRKSIRHGSEVVFSGEYTRFLLFTLSSSSLSQEVTPG